MKSASAGKREFGSLNEVQSYLHLYRQMALLRRFELTAQDLYKKGRMPGFIHLYIGQEAVAVGICSELTTDDQITSTHRGHGHALAKGVSPRAVLDELYGKATGCCGGRGGSMHLYEPSAGLFGTNGFVGGGIPAAVGVGLSARTRGTRDVAVAFFGDGAVNHGTFHESMNLAAALELPVLFVCENNTYATATPLRVATKNTNIASRGAAYGMPSHSVDGNDVLAIRDAAHIALNRARNGDGPTLIEARTYRTVGHHEGDPLVGTYRTQEELDEWVKRCPIRRFKEELLKGKKVVVEQLDAIDAEVDAELQMAVEHAESAPHPDPATAIEHVWAEPINSAHGETNGEVVQTWIEAVRDGIAEEMRLNPNIVYLGEGIGERGGSFAHTKNLWHEFGGRRVIDTPISELGFTGAAMGAAASGCPAVADLMFTDFLFEAASQIIEQAAKLHYMSNGRIRVPLVIRSGCGPIKNAGPHHSGTYHPIWAHCPGLIVALPSTPADAKGLMKSALRGSNPVILLEPKPLFAAKGAVPIGDHLVPFGQARHVRSGTSLSIITCGYLVPRCVEAADTLAKQGITCDIIDLRTIVPLDVHAIVQSAIKTHRVLVVDESFSMCGLGAEIAACLMEHAFDALDAPVGRLHVDPVAIPFSPALEASVLVSREKIIDAALSVMNGIAPRQRRLNIGSRKVNRPETCPPLDRSDCSGSPSSTTFSTMTDGVKITMPNQDLTVEEATVIRWLKLVGAPIVIGDELVEVETAKATSTIDSPASGTLVEITAPEQSVIRMGQVLGVIRPSSDGKT